MSWPEARFAINEGEEYLRQSKGKEGLGHLFGETRYLRLHLEGLKPAQRSQFEQILAEHLEIRHPRGFTLVTLLNAQAELVARGRLYLLEHEFLCTENRGQKRVFFCAPLQELRALKQIDSFYVGKLECEAFSLQYAGEEHLIMLGYETTTSSNLGTSSRWSPTGNAQAWLEALSEQIAQQITS